MHPDVARTLDNTASTYVAAQDYAKGLELYDEALAIEMDTLGADHPTTLTTMANRASVFVEMEQYDDAIDQYHEVLEATIRVMGAEHPQTATMYLNLAGVLGVAERFDESAEAATKGRLILESELGPEHGWVGYALINEGSARLERGETDLAIALLERANTTLEKLGGQPEKVASAQYALARALVRAGTDRTRAIDLMKRALDNYRSQNVERPEIQDELDALRRRRD
jgi:tetratricopeptide (TPR) repeat protein